MSRLKQIIARMCYWRSESGFSLFETVIALGVASISVLGAFGLTLAIENHYRNSRSLANMHGESRIAIERMFKELSETSKDLILKQSTTLELKNVSVPVLPVQAPQ